MYLIQSVLKYSILEKVLYAVNPNQTGGSVREQHKEQTQLDAFEHTPETFVRRSLPTEVLSSKTASTRRSKEAAGEDITDSLALTQICQHHPRVFKLGN